MARLADTVAGAPVASAWHNTNRDRTVTPFTNAGERTAQWPSPPAGAVSYLADTATHWYYNGTVWVSLADAYYAARGYRLAALNLPTGDTTIVWDNESYDTSGSLNITNGVYTAAATGLYDVRAVFHVMVNHAAVADYLMLIKNTTFISLGPTVQAAGANVLTGFQLLDTLQLTAGDAVTVKFHNGSGNTCAASTGAEYCYVCIRKVA